MQREDPRVSVLRAVGEWVAGLGGRPWQAPSVPWPEMSDQPHSDIRTAEIPGTDGVEIFYRHDFGTDIVDVIWVGRLPT